MGKNSDKKRTDEPTTGNPNATEHEDKQQEEEADAASSKTDGLPRALDTKDLPGLMAHHGIQIGKHAAELARQKEVIQDLEVALIGRIADVDDDRRQTLSRLNRALQTHREELDVRLRRHGSFVAAIMLLLLVLVGAGMGYLYLQLNSTRQALMEEMAKSRQTTMRAPARLEPAQDQATRKQLEQLSGKVETLGGAIKELREEQSAAETDSTPPSAGAATDEGTSEAAKSAEEPPPAETESSPALETQPARDDEKPSPPPAEKEPQAEKQPVPTEEKTPPDKSSSAADDVEPAADDKGQVGASLPTASGSETSALKIDGTPYALQIKATYSLDALRRFVAENDPGGPLYFREETYNGRPLFALIHSLYPTREAAEEGAKSLPPLEAERIMIRKLPPGAELEQLNP